MKNGIEKKIINGVLSCLPVVFFLCNFYRMLTGSATLYIASLFFAGAAGWFMVISIGITSRDKAEVMIFFAALTGCSLVSFLFNHNASFLSVFQNFCLMGVSYLLLNNPPSIPVAALNYYAVALVLLSKMITGVHSSIVLSSSSNYISVILIMAAVVYYSVLERSGNKLRPISFLPAIGCVLLSIWANGRSGIICSGILLLGVLFQYFINFAKMKNGAAISVVFFVLAGILMLVLFGLLYDRFDKFLISFKKEGMDNSARLHIWSDYINTTKKDLLYVLFGTPDYEVAALSNFEGNPHNSFFFLHMTHGLIGLLIILVYLIRAPFFYWKKKKYLHLTVFTAFILRAFFDKFAVMQYGMPILLYILFYPSFYKGDVTFKKKTEAGN